MLNETEPRSSDPDGDASYVQGSHRVPAASFRSLTTRTPVEACLPDVVDAARIGAWEWNVQTGELWLNDRWAEMLGYTLAELEPITIETCARLRHPEDQAAAMLKAERHLMGLEPYFEAEVRMRHKAGHWVWILDRARLVSRSEDGRPLIMVGAHQDITDRKAAEAELARANERLQLCMDIAGIGIWEQDLRTGEFRIDRKVREIYDLDHDVECLSRDATLNLVHPDDRQKLVIASEWAIETGQPVDTLFRYLPTEGAERHIQSHAVVVNAVSGNPVLLGVNRDVTEQVTRTTELEAKRIEAEAAAIAKGQFLATMSHEIRTPMNGVIGMLEVLRRAELGAVEREHAGIALQSATHLLHILDDILEVSRLEAGQMRLDPRDFNVRAMVGDVVDLFGRGALRQGVELVAEIDDDLPAGVIADEARLRQILTNFVGNAVKFTEAGRIVVEVSYRRDEARMMLAVRDTGIGIAPEACERLFQRFVQADASTTRRYGGTGLGLAICRQYADLMGGAIGVESEPGRGSRFWLDVPAPAGEGRGAVVDVPDEVSSRPLRILVAEDNETNQKVIASLLASFGHSSVIVPDGAQAVAAVSSGDFDVILMDVQMPVMDGPTATRHIRALGGRASMLPVIALTANAMPGQRAEYLAAGMTDYVSKPIDVATLFAALAKV